MSRVSFLLRFLASVAGLTGLTGLSGCGGSDPTAAEKNQASGSTAEDANTDAGPSEPTTRTKAGEPSSPAKLPEHVTFAEHVAPLVFEECTPCHREGGSGPFPFESFDDVSEHATQIAEVTHSGFMPPWLPEPGDFPLAGERRLSEYQRALLGAWAEQGANPGDLAKAPSLPPFTAGWQLGEPDLVLKMNEAYTLAPDGADGVDVYRNFVLPIPVDQAKFVRAVELRPGNEQVVHHAVIRVDTTSGSREADVAEAEPGFDGMIFGHAHMPGGHFLGWTPGRTQSPGSDDESWRLAPGTDFVLQMHLRPTGKPEPVQAEIGVYFAKSPPTKPYLALLLSSRDIDIAPGDAEFKTADSYVLPVEVELLSIYPHAHYLGKRLAGYATFPDGKRKTLIEIKEWDFNWQDQYRYEKPITLPRGTRIEMDFSHDNSADNPFNPANPPKPVKFGPQSTDEMSELIFEVTPKSVSDVITLDRDYRAKFNAMEVAYQEKLLAADPNNVDALSSLAMQLQSSGDHPRAILMLERAHDQATKNPDLLVALGVSLAAVDRGKEAIARYESALRIDPKHPQALNNLGNAHRKSGRADLALKHFERALALSPDNHKTLNNLGVTYRALGQHARAAKHFERAIAIQPKNALYLNNLGNARRDAGQAGLALVAYQAALEARAGWPSPQNSAAWILATSKDSRLRNPQAALSMAGAAAKATQFRSPEVLDTLAAAQAALSKFDAAVKTIDQAIALAERANLAPLSKAMKLRREAYVAGRAYQE